MRIRNSSISEKKFREILDNAGRPEAYYDDNKGAYPPIWNTKKYRVNGVVLTSNIKDCFNREFFICGKESK